MSLKLNGSIRYFPLINVFNFLVSCGATGGISIETDEKKGGSSLEKGKIVNAYYKNLADGEDALFKLFTIKDGNFYFKEEKIVNRTVRENTKTLIDEITKKLSDWDEIKKIIPSENICFKIVPVSTDFKQSKILMSREQWLVFTRLDGTRSVIDISKNLNMELLDVSEIIVNFFKLDFIKPVDSLEPREEQKIDRLIDASVLAGDLKAFSLLSIIDFLNKNNSTGRLKLSRGIYQGEIYLNQGKIVHASNNIWTGEMALVDLLSWIKGRFSFIPILPEYSKTVSTSVKEIVSTGGDNLNEWRKIQSVISTPEIIFISNISDQEKDEDEKLTFSRKHWKILYNIDGQTTVRKLSDKLKFKSTEVARIIYALYKEGLVEPSGMAGDTENPIEYNLEALDCKKQSEENNLVIEEIQNLSNGGEEVMTDNSDKKINPMSEPDDFIYGENKKNELTKAKENLDDLMSIMDDDKEQEDNNILDR